RVAGAAEVVPAQVVHQDEDNVGSRRCVGTFRGREQAQGGDHREVQRVVVHGSRPPKQGYLRSQAPSPMIATGRYGGGQSDGREGENMRLASECVGPWCTPLAVLFLLTSFPAAGLSADWPPPLKGAKDGTVTLRSELFLRVPEAV